MTTPMNKLTHQYTTAEQRQSFQEEGFIVMSGLLSEDETEALVAAGRAIIDNHQDQSSVYFKIAERGVMICGPSNPELTAECRSSTINAFRTVALRSKIAVVAAELMGLDEHEENVRILRDVFLGKSIYERKHCGWHVDDDSFWPESYTSSPSAHGINAWIAMQDMPSNYGGGLALAPGSHEADWKETAYESLGLDMNKGAKTKEEVYQQIKHNGFLSCVLDQTNKELHDQIEKIGHVPDLRCGDIIFHTRWLFHKTAPPTDEGRLYYEANGLTCLNRYSIRYVPGSAKLPIGFVNELSILSDPSNAGKALNDVEGAWYPQVWPFLEDDIETQMRILVSSKIPDATRTMQSNLSELLHVLSSSSINL